MAGTNEWWAYVRRVAGDASNGEIAGKSGVDSSTVTRWKMGQRPSVDAVLRFARSYEHSWKEALVASGYATERDFGADYASPQDISSYPDVMLLTEIQHRMSLRGHTDRR